jgi:hypothetical protein
MHDVTPGVVVRSASSEEVPGIVRDEVERPFDLRIELPLRVTVARLDFDEHLIVVLLHHITTDEWSDRPFLRDLASAYRARRTGGAPQWAPLPVQYADYTVWQRDVLDVVGEEQSDFWARTLAGAPEELELPVDRPRPGRSTFHGSDLEVVFEPGLADGLRSLGRSATRGWTTGPTGSPDCSPRAVSAGSPWWASRCPSRRTWSPPSSPP